MKLAFLVVILCGLAAARSYHAPLEVVYSKGHGKEMSVIQEQLQKLLENVLTMIKNAVETTGQLSEKVLVMVETTVTQVLEHVTHLSEGVLKTVRDLVSKTHGKLQEILQKILDKFDKKASQRKTVDILVDLANLPKLLMDLVAHIQSDMQISVDTVRELVQEVLRAIENIGSELANNNLLMNIFGGQIENALKEFKTFVSNLPGTTAQAIKDLLDKVITAVDNILGDKKSEVAHFHSVHHRSIVDDLRKMLIEVIEKITTRIRDTGVIPESLMDSLATILERVKMIPGAIHLLGEDIRAKLGRLMEHLTGRIKDLIASILDR